MTTEREVKMVQMIRGISQKVAYKFLTLDAEEIEQELWVHVMEREAAKGKELDLNLVAKICYDHVVDMQRYGARRNTSSYDELEAYCDEDDSIFGTNEEYSCDFDSKVMINDLIKLFPEGSRERTFLQFWTEYAGVQNFGIQIGHAPESELAKLLGYPGTGSSGYKKFRTKMRKFVAVYFDLGE